ncbi:hypothetical protein Glove_151g146 [Diversispora epigaea]|uniref:Uncharacterized protein n=1 Tax=Diversispora epigaea TaxID=1348612 RepID=A0A397ISX4_9GLOM|nr:hypothetical protein Glove_151g146 [Diversispora epigaea]
MAGSETQHHVNPYESTWSYDPEEKPQKGDKLNYKGAKKGQSRNETTKRKRYLKAYLITIVHTTVPSQTRPITNRK